MKGRYGVQKFDLFDVLNYTLLITFCIIAVYPMYYVLIGSFSDGGDYSRGGVFLFIRKFSLANYKTVFEDKRLITSFINSVLRTSIGTVTSVLFTSMVAYAMSRKNLRFRKTYYWINIFTLFFGGGLVPYFLVLKSMNLLNNFLVYIIPCLYSVFNMIILQNAFRDVPEEIHESAVMDGASEFLIFRRLMLPLCLPILATIALWNAVFHWNSFFDNMIFVTKPELMTLQLLLMKVVREADVVTDSVRAAPPQVKKQISIMTIRMATIMITTIPIVLAYPFVQRYFVTGIMVGAVKG